MAVVVPKTIIISSVPGKSPTIRNVYTSSQSQIQSNMAEDLLENGPRKRKRLTHLTPEERMMRRKLKNRVAAQTARDRKKERMVELEEALAKMEAENKKLQCENLSLKQQTGVLAEENVNLRSRLAIDNETQPKSAVVRSVGELGSPGSAASSLPLQQERIRALYKAATQYLTLLLCLSMTSSSGSSNKSQTPVKLKRDLISPSLRRKLVCLAQKAAELRQQDDPLVKWWGPQQRSWTPSRN